MYNYEKILYNELNYMRSCIMPDGSVLHRPIKSDVTQDNPDVIQVMPYDVSYVGFSLIANYNDTTTTEALIEWYFNNMIQAAPNVPTWAINTVPCYLYTVYPERKYTIEAIDYSFAEILKSQNDPTSPYYEMANDPVRNSLYQEYLRQAQSASMFLVFFSAYVKWTEDFTWGYAHLEDISMVANSVLNTTIQYISGNAPVSFALTLNSNFGDNTAYVIDAVSTYDGLLGMSQMLTVIENPSNVVFGNASNAISNGLDYFTVTNQYTAVVGTIFADSISNISEGTPLQINTPSVTDISVNWDYMSRQLQVYYGLGASQIQSLVINAPMLASAALLYTLLNQQYPEWYVKPPATYDGNEPWMVAGSVALQLGDVNSCVQQIINAQDARVNYWNVRESGWTVLNLLQLVRIYNQDPGTIGDTAWDTTLRSNIPISLAPLFEKDNMNVVSPKNQNNSLAVFLGNPLNINNQPTTLLDFLELINGCNILLINYYEGVTEQILALPELQGVSIFAYIGVGNGPRSTGLMPEEVMSLVDEYTTLGFTGVFYDAFGTQNGLTRPIQNQLIDYAHANNLQVFANADYASELCDSAYDPTYNPNGDGSHLMTGDIFMIENFATNYGNVDDNNNDSNALIQSFARGNDANFYKQQYNFEIATLSYASLEDTPDHWEFNENDIFEVIMDDADNVGVLTSFEQYIGDYTVMNTALNRTVEFGAKWIRNYCYWSQVEYGFLGNRDYTIIDQVVDAAVGDNFNILLVLAYDNSMAPIVNNWDLFLGAYVGFVTDTVTRFKNRVNAWEIWSYENIQEYWQIQPNPVQYMELLATVYTTIKSIDPDAIVVLGSITSIGVMNDIGQYTPGPIIDLEYIGALYAMGAQKYFDILSLDIHIPAYMQTTTNGVNNPNLSTTPTQFIMFPTTNPEFMAQWDAFEALLTSFNDAGRAVWIITGLPSFTNDTYMLPDDFQYYYLYDFLNFLKAGNYQKLFIRELVSSSADTTNPLDNFGIMEYNFSAPNDAYLLIKTLLRGCMLPYNIDTIMPIWQYEVQYAYVTFLMLGLDYFNYSTFYNLSFAINVETTPIPLVNAPTVEVPEFLSPFPTGTVNGLYLRNLHSGVIGTGVGDNGFEYEFIPHIRPLTTNVTCPSCISILENLESEGFNVVLNNTILDPYEVIAPFTINGWDELKKMEALGWNTLDSNFGVNTTSLNTTSSLTPISNVTTSLSGAPLTMPNTNMTMGATKNHLYTIDLNNLSVNDIIAVLQVYNVDISLYMSILQTNNIALDSATGVNLNTIITLLNENGINASLGWFQTSIPSMQPINLGLSNSMSPTNYNTISALITQAAIIQQQVSTFNELISLSTEELSSGRWCNICGYRVL